MVIKRVGKINWVNWALRFIKSKPTQHSSWEFSWINNRLSKVKISIFGWWYNLSEIHILKDLYFAIRVTVYSFIWHIWFHNNCVYSDTTFSNWWFKNWHSNSTCNCETCCLGVQNNFRALNNFFETISEVLQASLCISGFFPSNCISSEHYYI